MIALGRVAALYDIHGNLPALEAVLEDVQRARVDLIVVGGDVVPGPMPRETLERLRVLERPTRFIRGNGESAVLEQLAGREPVSLPERVRPIVRWVAEQLGADLADWLSEWPAMTRATVDGSGRVLFCHATPRNDTEIFTRVTPEERLRPIFDGLDTEAVVCGHTHIQFDRTIGRTRVINAGSVGMPFGEPGAYWLLLGPGIELRRTTYDLAAAAERIRRAGYPAALEFAERNVLRPPTEAEMLAGLGRAELTG